MDRVAGLMVKSLTCERPGFKSQLDAIFSAHLVSDLYRCQKTVVYLSL